MKYKTNRVRQLFIFLSTFHFLGCEVDRPRGTFYDVESRVVYDFSSTRLEIYSLNDSTFIDYKLEFSDNNLVLTRDNKVYNVEYNMIAKDKLVLDDPVGKVIPFEVTEMDRFELADTYDLINLLEGYWSIDTQEDEYRYIFKLSSENSGFDYTISNNSVDFKGRFYHDVYLPFNKFIVLEIQSSTFQGAVFFVKEITKDSLVLVQIDNLETFTFDKVPSKVNNFVYGNWSRVSSSREDYEIETLLGNEYFGDEIKIFQDEIYICKSPDSEVKKFKFDLGFDSHYLLMMEYGYIADIKIKKITKDTLILENPSNTRLVRDSGVMVFKRGSP